MAQDKKEKNTQFVKSVSRKEDAWLRSMMRKAHQSKPLKKEVLNTLVKNGNPQSEEPYKEVPEAGTNSQTTPVEEGRE